MKYLHKIPCIKVLKEHSLARTMALVIVLAVMLIFVASSSVFLAVTSRTHQTQFEQNRIQHVSFLTDNLQLPLGNCDSMAIRQLGRMMMEINSVCFVAIKDASGNLIFSDEKSGESKDFVQRTDITYREKSVGSFELGLSDGQFKKQQQQWILSGLANSLIIIIGIIFSVVFSVNRFFKKPLSNFSNQMKTMAQGNYTGNNGAKVYLELKDVFACFHQMVTKIKERQKELMESNKKLEREIEKHRETEQLLGESEEKYRSFNNNVPIGFFRIGVDGSIVEYNSFLLKFLNIPDNADIKQYNGEDFYLNPSDRQRMIRKILQDNSIHGFECQAKKKGDQIAWVSISAQAIKDTNGNVEYIDGAFEDITEKKAREEQLIQFVKIIEQADEEVVITSPKGIIQYVNPSFEQNTGYLSDEVIGKTPSILKSGLHDRAYYKAVWGTILNSTPWKGVMKNKAKDGSIILHDTAITPIIDSENKISAFVSIRRDITKQKEIEKQLFQSQKMQAIGTLAGGIAHDFNNILSGIFGYSQLAQMNIKTPQKVLDSLSNIVKASQRASELVQQILTFTRQEEYEKKPYCIYLEVNEVLKLIRSSIPVNIKIQNRLISRSLVSADPTKIHQVVMNLCTNAYHAMEDSGGTLTVSLDDVDISESRFLKTRKMPKGRYLLLKIIDTGCGMDAKTLEKVFEPYFTTKKMGQGTGLGLPIVQAVVEEHDGFLDVESSIGTGTQFSLYFPIVERQARKKKAVLQQKPKQNGNETIMLVDDEKDIRDSCKDFLERYGYRVSVFSDGKEAITAFQSDPFHFDLVITDMAMQERTGSDLVQAIRSLNKTMPIIICSGFSSLLDEKTAHQIGADKYLMKPLQLPDLLTEARALLDKENL